MCFFTKIEKNSYYNHYLIEGLKTLNMNRKIVSLTRERKD